jgi:hypothetical protein
MFYFTYVIFLSIERHQQIEVNKNTLEINESEQDTHKHVQTGSVNTEKTYKKKLQKEFSKIKSFPGKY